MLTVNGADGKILILKFPNVTAADYGVYIVAVPLDGESIDSAGVSLRQIGKICERETRICASLGLRMKFKNLFMSDDIGSSLL